mmetsp:Transcript_9349/g.27915  ORF Transcript_9349/g.27915 Transcript_9349/m.27915 type:complete len:95 (-) Transcript_9349:1032-1316(-)
MDEKKPTFFTVLGSRSFFMTAHNTENEKGAFKIYVLLTVSGKQAPAIGPTFKKSIPDVNAASPSKSMTMIFSDSTTVLDALNRAVSRSMALRVP